MEMSRKLRNGSVFGICADITRTISTKDEYSWNVKDTFRWPVSIAQEIPEFRNFWYGDCKKGQGKLEYSSNRWEFKVDGVYVHCVCKFTHQFKPLPGSKLLLDELEGFGDMQEY